MPRTAVAASPRQDDEMTMTHVDELIQRGRGQGHLSLSELRAAFEQARISPTEARSIIRELTEAGVQLGNESSDIVPSETGPAGPAPAGPGPAGPGPAPHRLALPQYAPRQPMRCRPSRLPSATSMPGWPG